MIDNLLDMESFHQENDDDNSMFHEENKNVDILDGIVQDINIEYSSIYSQDCG